MRPKSEFKKFEELFERVISVPYDVIKAKIEAKKEEREKRKANASASSRASKTSHRT